MSNDSLLQRHFFETRFFQIKENGVRFVIKNLLGSESALVPYENIPIEPYETTQVSRISLIWIYVGLVFVIYSLIGIVSGKKEYWVVLSVVILLALIRLFLFRKSFVIFGQGQQLRVVLLKERPSKEAFDNFVNQMQLKKNSYLRERYLVFQFNANNPSHVQTVHWLKTMGAMKQEEVERLIKDYPLL